MGLKQRKLQALTEQIIKEQLKKGNLPTSRNFIFELNKRLEEEDPSRPSFSFRTARKSMAAKASQINEAFDSVYKDLSFLYTSIIELEENVGLNFEKFRREKEKIEKEINILEKELVEKIMLYQNTGFLAYSFDTFDNMEKIDTEKTTVDVDTQKNEVVLNNNKTRSKLIEQEASVSFSLSETIEKESKVEKVSGSTNHMLNSFNNEYWSINILSKSPSYGGGDLLLSFDKKQSINEIQLRTVKSYPFYIEVSFTPDKINWFQLPYHEDPFLSEESHSLVFPEIDVYGLNLKLTKDKPDNDRVSIDYPFEYQFGIEQLLFLNKSYEEEGMLYSTTLPVNSFRENYSVNKVSLKTEEEKPEGTDIYYEVALENNDWQAIDPINKENPTFTQIVDFKNIKEPKPIEMVIPEDISIKEYEREELEANGLSFFSIGEIEKDRLLDRSEKIYVGKNSWKVEYFEGEYSDHETHKPTIEDWAAPLFPIQQTYRTMEEGKGSVLLEEEKHVNARSYKFSCAIFNEDKEKIISGIPSGNEHIVIYLNGEELFNGVPSKESIINYKLGNGWNNIIVLSYIKNINALSGSTINIGFSPLDHANYIYSQEETLKSVSLFNLRYNTRKDDRSVYAMREVNDKYEVIINHAVPGLIYSFYYDEIQGDIVNNIKLRARLIRDTDITTLSPKLKKYELHFA